MTLTQLLTQGIALFLIGGILPACGVETPSSPAPPLPPSAPEPENELISAAPHETTEDPAPATLPGPVAVQDEGSAAAREDGETEIDFALLDQVRSLDLIEPSLAFPSSLIALDGRQVTLVGFMAPFDSLEDMRRCMIVPGYVGCTFCSPPNLTQVLYVTQGEPGSDSSSFPFIDTAVRVEGTLRLSQPSSEHEGSRQGFIYSLEDATTIAHGAEALAERAAVHGTAPHQAPVAELGPMQHSELVRAVTEIVQRKPLRPIEITRVPEAEFEAELRSAFEATFPGDERGARAKAFQLLGFLPDGAAWIDSLMEFQLSRRVAVATRTGDRVLLLETVPDDHPYTRLDLVGEVATAIMRQHGPFPAAQQGAESAGEESDDTRRAREALMEGFRTMTIRRFATPRGIPTDPPIPLEIKSSLSSLDFGRWQATTRYCGFFFVRALIGDAGPLADLRGAFLEPPTVTLQLFRPLWHQDPAQWRANPVPADFANDLQATPPALTDVLGVAGLLPFLTQWYSLDESLGYVGGWTGDRWALWHQPDGTSKLLLETRWTDEEAALRFRNSIPADSPWTLPPHEEGSRRVRLQSRP